MSDELDNCLDVLTKFKKGDRRTIKDVYSLHSPKMRNLIKKIIRKTGLHQKLSVNFIEVIDDIEQETWIKLIRTLNNTSDIKNSEWLTTKSLEAVLMTLTNNSALNFTAARGKKRNLKVDKNIPVGESFSFASLEKMIEDKDSRFYIENELTPEGLYNEEKINTEFIESLSTNIEKEIIPLLLQGKKRQDIVDALNITLYEYNKALKDIKLKAHELDFMPALV